MVFKNGKLKKDYKGNRTGNDMFKFFKPYMVILDKKTRKSKPKRKSKRKKTRYNR